MAQNNNADLSVACVPSYLHYEGTVSNNYRAHFNVGGVTSDWDIEQYIFPLPMEKQENLYKAGIVTSPESVKEYEDLIKKQLNKEGQFQKSLMAADNESLTGCCVKYVYVTSENHDGKTFYYLLSAPNEPLCQSRFMDREKMTFTALLELSKALLKIVDTFVKAGVKNFKVTEKNLIVDGEGNLKLRAFYSEENINSEDYGLKSVAALIWHLASGKRSEIGGGASLHEGYPKQFRNFVERMYASSEETYSPSEGIRLLDKLLTDIRTGAANDFIIRFPKAEAAAKAENAGNGYPRFNIKKYIEEKRQVSELDIITDSNSDILMKKFEDMCLMVKKLLDDMDANEIKEEATLNRQRRALLGYPQEVEYYRARINEIVIKNGLSKAWKPAWYRSVAEAIYGEILGFSGISNWLSDEKYKDSISCKIIGDRIYYKGASGYLELQPQKISKDRRDLLKRTLLLVNPKEPLSRPWHEVYTASEHLRVTIYNDNGVTKGGEDTIILRRYILKNLSLDEFARRGTFPPEAKPLIESMAKLGFNICFSGPVESGKSTFLQAYQQLEDQKLEAVSIETDDETQYQRLMPQAPIMQFVPSREQEDTVLERVKRSDANYIVIGEARSGKYLAMAVEAANMGTRRMKMTFHNTETIDFAYDVAEKITKDYGGDIVANMIKVSKSFDYIFVLTSLPGNRAKKKLKGIWEMDFDSDRMQIVMTQICKYIPAGLESKEQWVWTYHISESKQEEASWESPEALRVFDETLASLARANPNTGETRFRNPYMDVFLGRGQTE